MVGLVLFVESQPHLQPPSKKIQKTTYTTYLNIQHLITAIMSSHHQSHHPTLQHSTRLFILTRFSLS